MAAFARYFPEAQSTQVGEAAPLYCSVLQFVQDAGSKSLYCPAEHSEHEEEPEEENFPATQMTQKSTESSALYLPAGQEEGGEHVLQVKDVWRVLVNSKTNLRETN